MSTPLKPVVWTVGKYGAFYGHVDGIRVVAITWSSQGYTVTCPLTGVRLVRQLESSAKAKEAAERLYVRQLTRFVAP